MYCYNEISEYITQDKSFKESVCYQHMMFCLDNVRLGKREIDRLTIG
jgi:hypothetical protein